MKKVFSKILISLVIMGFFLAPVSIILQTENNALITKISVNQIYAGQAEVDAAKQAHLDLQNAEKALIDGINNGLSPDEITALKEAVQKYSLVYTDAYNKLTEDEKKLFQQQANTSGNSIPDYLNCSDGYFDFNIPGCIAIVFYTLWEASAWVARLAGGFLDFFVYYSTNSNSYKSDFVEKGWAVVRDIANIFFIIALLFVAIKTVLSMNVSNNKKLVGMIIVMALLINFSLFTTKVVIDASNILAKIFYNNISSVDKDGKAIPPEDGGEKSISVGIIDKFDPQELLSDEVYDKGKGAGQFIFLTIILLFITIYTAYVFFSVAILFVARVISLWLAMIFAPLAFASYTVPFDMGGLGHKKWWPDLLQNAFLAPLFIFFLYLIALFLDIGSSVTYSDSNELLQRIMSTLIPFIIIAALLMKAKEMAVKMSGEMGGAIMKGAATVGGLALGGAALGVAAVGRGTVGAFMKGASTGDTAAQRYRDGTSKNMFDNLKGRLTSGTGWERMQTRVGRTLNTDQTRVEHAQHARHELDKEAGARFNGKKFSELSGAERDTVRQRISRDHEGEARYGKKYTQLTTAQKTIIDRTVTPQLAGRTSHADTLLTRSRDKQGLASSLMQGARTGSFDVRNLSKVVATEGDTGNVKALSGLTSTLASTMRSSIKGAFGAQYGSGQKEFFKDLGNTLSEALKGMNIQVDLSHVGKVEKEKPSGGGGHH